MFNTMVFRNPGRDLHCSISLTQALLVERASQQHVSPFVPDARMPQNTTEYPPLKVGFRRKLQDTDTVWADLAQATAPANWLWNSGQLHRPVHLPAQISRTAPVCPALSIPIFSCSQCPRSASHRARAQDIFQHPEPTSYSPGRYNSLSISAEAGFPHRMIQRIPTRSILQVAAVQTMSETCSSSCYQHQPCTDPSHPICAHITLL